MSPVSESIQIAANVISGADGLLITAGAGLGVDSGLPDFRGIEGFWKAYPALRQAGINFQTIASPGTFRSDSTRAWGFYGHRLVLYRQAIPHEGFAILRDLARFMEHGAFIFTSNVDGQFQKAGFGNGQMAECHGSLHHLQCLDGCMGDIWPAKDFQPEVDVAHCRLLNAPPHCQWCGGIARPNILMFGDAGWLDYRFREQEANLQQWLAKVKRLAIIEIGAGASIPTVRHFGEFQTGFLIRINPNEAQLPKGRRGICLQMGGLDALRGIHLALDGG
jgi:NAD-dependent SIR2 family protein deacetylase